MKTFGLDYKLMEDICVRLLYIFGKIKNNNVIKIFVINKPIIFTLL